MKRIFTSLALLSFLSACAAGPGYQPTPFDRNITKVDEIKLVTDTMPELADIRKFATNGGNIASAAASSAGLAGLGVALIAGGIEAGIAAKQRGALRDILAAEKFDGEAIFNEALIAALKEQNYTITQSDLKHKEDRSFLVLNAQTDAAANTSVLDIAGNSFGYQLAGSTTMWRPYVSIKVKMTDAKDPNKVLLDNMVEYNSVAPATLTINLPVDDQYAFKKIEDMTADHKKVTEGLKKALVESANATAKLLK